MDTGTDDLDIAPAPPPTPPLRFRELTRRLRPPYTHQIVLDGASDRIYAAGELADGSMVGRHILPGDLLFFDAARTAPVEGAIVNVNDGEGFVPRVVRRDGDFVAFHPAAPGYPILGGERRIGGTLVGLIRLTDGRVEDEPAGADPGRSR